MLFYFQRCSRRFFLDRFGDLAQQDEPSDYLLKIRQDSALHRRQILESYVPRHRPRYPTGHWLAGAAATRDLMEQGVDYIYQGILVLEGPEGLHYVGQPDLLVKQTGASWLGDWHYAPINIKLGKKPKLEYQLVATFHAYLLSALQGIWSAESRLILREKDYVVDLDRQLPRLLELLDDCYETLQADAPPEVFISRSRCDMCVWLPHCYQIAQSQQHLSLLPGVTANRYQHLATLGLTTVDSLAAIEPARLSIKAGFELSIAEKLVHQAQAARDNVAIARTRANTLFPLLPSDLPSANVELYFDIEAAPDRDLVYLHGLLVIDHAAQSQTFLPLMGPDPTDEAAAWKQFQQVVAQYPDKPIYHFCPYEAQTVRRLADTYGSQLDIDSLLRHFVDIHKCVTEAVTLPVESYALKHIARWMGFEWRDAEANGAQSICWYDSWLATGDERYLEAILRYNEDDCRATYHVKQWLARFAEPFWR
ncbi:MAG: TM0106 family RecB-like putative nuclease [Leptolyngbya sp. SIO4C1]|nr:TM0106 family RecB-like putative nuclease [Leptolyngbya sp. SIO4C1]